MALAVTLSGTFLLGSMVLYAVPTFLVPAFPARDSPSHRGGKDTELMRNGECGMRNFYKPGPTGKIIIKGCLETMFPTEL